MHLSKMFCCWKNSENLNVQIKVNHCLLVSVLFPPCSPLWLQDEFWIQVCPYAFFLRDSYFQSVFFTDYNEEVSWQGRWGETRERWRKNGFDLEARGGHTSPRGLRFLKGACSLQGRCSLFPSLLCLSSLCMPSSSSLTTPATQDQLWLTSAVVQNSFKWLDLWVDISPPPPTSRLPSSSSLLTPTSHR